MSLDYEPLDLSAFRNGGIDLLGDAPGVPLGGQTLHGLPFHIGCDGCDAGSFLAFGDRLGVAPVEIPIDRAARTVVVAHRLLESQILDGGPVGTVAAEYVVCFADGAEVVIPIRERFEIAIPSAWGQLPFLALPDRKNSLPPRWEGRWSAAGQRQMEVVQGTAAAYFLWAWRNPRPDVPIATLRIAPKGPRFIIAGITLGHVDEYPLGRAAAVPIRVELKEPTIAARPFDVAVDVDRGVAGYPFPLPAAPAESFLGDGMAGWGEALNGRSASSYVNVAANPSATVTISSAGEPVDRVRWGDLVAQGTVETERVRVSVIEDGRNWVETTIVDDTTGQPIPCRVHFRSIHGVPYQPYGHHSQLNSNNGTWHIDIGGDLRLGQISYAYIDGRCEGWLPRGEVLVDVVRGYEYEPIRQRVTIAPGQQRLELRLRRWTDMNARGWYSGDTHVHFLSTVGSDREARGEDLNVVNLLPAQWGSLFTNFEEFTGEPHVSRDGRTIVWVSQESRQHLLGHLSLLGLRRLVLPSSTDGPGEAAMGGALEITMAEWADRCRAQGGTVILPHFPNPNGEPAALIATGRVDGIEMFQFSDYTHREYYRYLNAGYRLPLVGGTDKMTAEVAVGQYRTYVYIPPDEGFSHESWCRNLKLGRTFMSGGPMLELSVDGHQIGETLQLPAEGGTVEVVATAGATMPIHTLQIVQNGRVVAETAEPRGDRRLSLHARLPIDGHSWLCARVSGPSYRAVSHHDVWSRGVFAHTSPIYVACGGAYERHDRAGLQYMLTLVDGSLEYLRGLAPTYRPGSATYHHGQADHQAYLERPFLEAREALHRRLHQLGVAH